MTRPLRTTLALIGLSIPILGVMGLFSVSRGLRNMVGDTLSRVEGVMVIRENQPSPVFSDLKADVGDEIRRLPGVRVVAPEIWKIAPPIEGKGMLSGLRPGKTLAQSIFDQPVIQGQDIPTHRLLHSAVYPRALKEKGEGRFLDIDDKGEVEHRHQPQGRARPPRRAGQPAEGRRHAPDRREGLHHRRAVRDRVDAPGRRRGDGHRHGARPGGILQGHGLQLLCRDRRPDPQRAGLRGDRGGRARGRRAGHE